MNEDLTKITRLVTNSLTAEKKVETIESIYEDKPSWSVYARTKNAWQLNSGRLSLPKSTLERNLDLVNKKIARRNRLLMFGSYFRKYAAFLVIALLSGYLFSYIFNTSSNGKLNQIEVPLGQTAKVTLPDNSIVWLNSGSKLTYSNLFESKKRVVNIEGEAYLKVEKNKKIPFIIENNLLEIEVTGTEFNYKAYADEDIASATLVEGGIIARHKQSDEIVVLIPGQRVVCNGDVNDLHVEKVKTELYTSWKEGYIVSKNKPLRDFFDLIERWYNVEIEIENKAIENQLYTGTIMRNKPIDQVFIMLNLTAGINYEIQNKAGEKCTIKIK